MGFFFLREFVLEAERRKTARRSAAHKLRIGQNLIAAFHRLGVELYDKILSVHNNSTLLILVKSIKHYW